MNENDFGRRYLEKMRGLMREDGHIARVNDLLARIKVKLPQLEELLAQIEDRSGEEDGSTVFTISRSKSLTCRS